LKTLINKEQVSHIKIHDFQETKYVWRDAWWSKLFWLIPINKNPAGYYHREYPYACGRLEDTKGKEERYGVLCIKPCMKIYSGGRLIHKITRNSVKELLEICREEFPNVNIDTEHLYYF
jgi:hypothetical protein